jgi:hypothetical protein
MGSNTEYNRKKRALLHLRDLYSKARIFHMTSEAITKEYIEQILNRDLAKATIATREYIRGFADCLYFQLQNEMEFCYEVDGILYTTTHDKTATKARWDTLPDYNMSGKKCGHYWFNTDKLYGSILIA